jgi:hypothetical protein
MPQIVTCSQCAQRLNIPDTFRGTRAKCPKCGGAVEIPAPTPAPAEPEMSSVVAADDYRRTAPPPPPPAGKPEASGASLGLGIGSLVVGILSFLVALVPCLGIFAVPLAAVGLILGVVGAVIAFTRGGAGLGFPIAGSAVNVVAILVAVAWFIGARYMAMQSAQKFGDEMTKAIENMDVETTTIPMVMDNVPPDAVWTDAKEAAEIGDVRVKIVNVKLGKVPLKRMRGTQKSSTNDYMTVTLSIENRSPNRDLIYQGWGSVGDTSYVRDNLGQLLSRAQFGTMRPDGQADPFRSIQRGTTLRDVIVFSRPEEGFKNLRLALPAQTIGGNGYFRFDIPASMVQK